MSADPAPSGPTKHVITPGEQGIARAVAEHGFHSVDAVWNAPENADLKRRRVNPHTLAVNDVVVIPALDPKVESRATDQTHTFTLAAGDLLLNLRLESEARRPFAERAFALVIGTRTVAGQPPTTAVPITGVTTKNGEVQAEISNDASAGELRVHATDDTSSPIIAVIQLLIGFLEPADTPNGQRTRLNNMGYFAGFTEKDSVQLTWAIEEFQQDHGIKPNGRTDDRLTFNKIAHKHGDLLESESLP